MDPYEQTNFIVETYGALWNPTKNKYHGALWNAMNITHFTWSPMEPYKQKRYHGALWSPMTKICFCHGAYEALWELMGALGAYGGVLDPIGSHGRL